MLENVETRTKSSRRSERLNVSPLLPFDQRNEVIEAHDRAQLFRAVRSVDAAWDHKRQPFDSHCIGLHCGNPSFQSAKMLIWNSGSLGKYLTPSLLATRFRCQHSQRQLREFRVVIFRLPWEYEVRRILAFSLLLRIESKRVLSEKKSQVMLQCLSHARFSSILD